MEKQPQWKIRTLCGCAADDNGTIEYCRTHAVAPEMVECLRQFVDQYEALAHADCWKFAHVAYAILAKIEGSPKKESR
ncbi:MAG: hypothetical protein ACRDHF_13365 [Tepidiformaceae bacterium]